MYYFNFHIYILIQVNPLKFVGIPTCLNFQNLTNLTYRIPKYQLTRVPNQIRHFYFVQFGHLSLNDFDFLTQIEHGLLDDLDFRFLQSRFDEFFQHHSN